MIQARIMNDYYSYGLTYKRILFLRTGTTALPRHLLMSYHLIGECQQTLKSNIVPMMANLHICKNARPNLDKHAIRRRNQQRHGLVPRSAMR